MPATLRKTFQKEILSFSSMVIIFFLGFLYICLSIFLLNSQLVWTTVANNFPFAYKIRLFSSLITGLWTIFSPFDFFVLIITAFLVGANVFLAVKTLSGIESNEKMRFSVGGATIVSLATTGCTSCGISLLSVLGLSASFSFLPFHGRELRVFAIALLIFSCIYMLKNLHKTKYCKVASKRTVK